MIHAVSVLADRITLWRDSVESHDFLYADLVGGTPEEKALDMKDQIATWLDGKDAEVVLVQAGPDGKFYPKLRNL